MTQHTTNTPDVEDGYALDLTGPVQHIASELAKADPEPVTITDLAAGYSHFAGDLSRVRKHEHLDDNAAATTWLIEKAAAELTQNGSRGRVQLTVEDGYVSLVTGVKVEDLRWRGNPVYPPQNIHGVMDDPFNPMSGKYARNVRKNIGPDNLNDLKESMRVAGWLPGNQAVKDVRTLVTISGHRRLKAAAELRAEGVDIQDDIKYVDFEVDGEGDPADVHRMDLALLSNYGFKRITPEERQQTALWLSERRGKTQQEIAELLGVSQQTVSRDLNKILTQMSNSDLEPLITAAVAAIRRGLTQSQFGVERGMSNNSMVLAKAFAVATDRLKREAEDAQRARDAAAAEFPDVSDQVRAAIEEGEAMLAGTDPLPTTDDWIGTDSKDDQDDAHVDPASGRPYDAELCEHALGTCPEDCDCRCDYCMDRRDHEPVTSSAPPWQDERPLGSPAVNPPSELPPAPQPYDDPFGGDGDPVSAEAWSWSDAANAWVLQRGRYWVSCDLPKDTVPVFPAHLFGVFTIEPAGGPDAQQQHDEMIAAEELGRDEV
jgi:predicted transcriptional regulator